LPRLPSLSSGQQIFKLSSYVLHLIAGYYRLIIGMCSEADGRDGKIAFSAESFRVEAPEQLLAFAVGKQEEEEEKNFDA
jgi:hypothetical protein